MRKLDYFTDPGISSVLSVGLVGVVGSFSEAGELTFSHT